MYLRLSGFREYVYNENLFCCWNICFAKWIFLFCLCIIWLPYLPYVMCLCLQRKATTNPSCFISANELCMKLTKINLLLNHRWFFYEFLRIKLNLLEYLFIIVFVQHCFGEDGVSEEVSSWGKLKVKYHTLKCFVWKHAVFSFFYKSIALESKF